MVKLSDAKQVQSNLLFAFGPVACSTDSLTRQTGSGYAIGDTCLHASIFRYGGTGDTLLLPISSDTTRTGDDIITVQSLLTTRELTRVGYYYCYPPPQVPHTSSQRRHHKFVVAVISQCRRPSVKQLLLLQRRVLVLDEVAIYKGNIGKCENTVTSANAK